MLKEQIAQSITGQKPSWFNYLSRKVSGDSLGLSLGRLYPLEIDNVDNYFIAYKNEIIARLKQFGFNGIVDSNIYMDIEKLFDNGMDLVSYCDLLKDLKRGTVGATPSRLDLLAQRAIAIEKERLEYAQKLFPQAERDTEAAANVDDGAAPVAEQ